MVVWCMEDLKWQWTGTLDPSFAAVVARKNIPQVCQSTFFLFSWIKNTLIGKQFEDVELVKLKALSRDA